MLKCVKKVDWIWINYGAKTRQYLFLSVMRMNLNMIVLKIQSMPKKQ